MTPFEKFHEEVFQPTLAQLDEYDSGPVFTNGHGIAEASWDRKASYLLWLVATGQMELQQ